MHRAYRESTRVMSGLLVLLGLGILVSTLASGGGPLALGVIVGVLFSVLGAARLYLTGGARRPPA